MRPLLAAFLLFSVPVMAQGGPPCVDVSQVEALAPNQKLAARGVLADGNLFLVFAGEDQAMSVIVVYAADTKLRFGGGVLTVPSKTACRMWTGDGWESLAVVFGEGV